jgi:hypothetical protein
MERFGTDYAYSWGCGYSDGFNGNGYNISAAEDKNQYRDGYEEGAASRAGKHDAMTGIPPIPEDYGYQGHNASAYMDAYNREKGND